MSNYIDSDRIDLKNYLMHKDGKVLYSDDFFAGIKWVLDRIDEMPSIDICFCKECVKHKTHRCHMAFDLIATEDNDFCSYGERSEKPNNSTISKMEQVDEPQSEQWHYDEKDNTWYPYQHKSCATCKHALGNWDGESNNCGRCYGADRRFYESIEDEPQTERSSE